MNPQSQVSLKRGTNISHWLSQSDARGAERRARLTRDDIRRLADLGLTHLRLPVDEEQMWTRDNKPEPEAFDLLNQALDAIFDDGMNAIIDLHILRSHHFNTSEKALFSSNLAVSRFAQCWRDLSAAFHSRPNHRLAYELMNEAVADNPADWNRVLLAPYHALRQLEPTRSIVIGSNRWNQAAQYAFLEVPPNDPNIILTFHYYDPMLVTHYRAPWCPEIATYEGPIQYPGLPVPQELFDKLPLDIQRCCGSGNIFANKDTMRASLLWPLAVRARTGLPLYCGEFGVNARAPENVRRAWSIDFRSLLEELDIAWANWDFRGSFGLYDSHNKETCVLEALLRG